MDFIVIVKGYTRTLTSKGLLTNEVKLLYGTNWLFSLCENKSDEKAVILELCT